MIDNLECFLGIDWSITKIEIIRQILQDKGYEAKRGEQVVNVKKLLNDMVRKAKKNENVTKLEMCTVMRNLDKCDHHDLCRLDLVMTIETNRSEAEYQWGSVVLGCKWKIVA